MLKASRRTDGGWSCLTNVYRAAGFFTLLGKGRRLATSMTIAARLEIFCEPCRTRSGVECRADSQLHPRGQSPGNFIGGTRSVHIIDTVQSGTPGVNVWFMDADGKRWH